MKLKLGVGLALALCSAAALPAAPDTNARRPAPPSQLVVLDVEISGDLGGPALAATHQARLNEASARLRESLVGTGLYQLLDTAAAQDVIDRLKSLHLYLHDCNGCDLEVGRELGADQVLVTWVHRVSALILTLTYEIHDVMTGEIIARKSFDFRGDNDAAWARAVDYMVRDLKESAAARSSVGEQ